LGVFGAVTARKNIDMIIDAIENDPKFGLLIAGSIDEGAYTSLEKLEILREKGRLVVFDGGLDEESLDSAIAAVDIVVAAHSNEGPSGIVAKGAFLGKPLVLGGAKSLKRDARQLGAQAVWTKLSAPAIHSALEEISRPIAKSTDSKLFPDDLARKLLS
jgi:glycosyltransferase involved in cell wall biosynthesis